MLPFQHNLTFSPKEESMSKRKGKTISFDAMVKFFMQNYNIPTKKDVDRLMAKLDRLENLMKVAIAAGGYPVKGRGGETQSRGYGSGFGF